MSESRRRARAILSGAESAARRVEARGEAASAVADPATKRSLRAVAKPNSVSGALRKTGVALIVAPDPISAVPGAVMLVASLAAKRREPIKPASVLEEARKLLDELGSSI